MTEESKFELTSTAIKQATDGNYPYYQCSFLIPHEMLRREMHRLANAINNLDLAKSPWKIYCLKEWYQVFFMPVLEDHHHNEETIFFPHYKELGNAFQRVGILEIDLSPTFHLV